MSKKELSTFKVAATYIGTVVGAGFATGQEILQFFGFFGVWGLLGIAIATLLFAYFGYIVMGLGRGLNADSHLPVIKYAGGKYVGRVLDYVIIFFLFGALTAMAAGAGAIFQEQFGLPVLLGNLLMIIATVVTVLAGIEGVISAISFVVPLLLVAVIGISLYNIFFVGFTEVNLGFSQPGQAPVPFWPFSALIYTSYNMVMAVAVLAPLGKATGNQLRLRSGAIWGALGLGVGAAAIMLAVLLNMPQAGRFAIPMIFVAGNISPLVQTIYSGVLFAEVYTTAVGSLYGFVARLTNPDSPKVRTYVILTSIGAFVASLLGFTNLVRYLFSGVGYLGLLLLGGLVWTRIKEKVVTGIPYGPKPATQMETAEELTPEVRRREADKE